MRDLSAEQVWELVRLPSTKRRRTVPTSQWATVLTHRPLADRYRCLSLDTPEITERAQPGQFVMLTVARRGESTPVLPRPMAIYRVDRDRGTIDILYGVVGSGTRRLATFLEGEQILVVGPLGRPFEVGPAVRSTLLISRGIGTCSLTTVAQENQIRGVATLAVSSARHRDAVIGADLYHDCGAKALYEVNDDDGTSEPDALFDRLTADLDNDPPGLILTCGSQRLIRLSERLSIRWGCEVQVSMEAHMACGLGYCHGCASGARSEGDESPLICTDGPVFGWRPQSEVQAQ